MARALVALSAGMALPIMAAAQDLPVTTADAPAPDQAYRYIDDADALLDAMGTSPPDHGFRFDGIDCWAWTMADGSTILAEPLGDDYRYYVFAPGDDYPFFVGDQTYAYGFDQRTLAAVYGNNGDLVDPTDDMIDGADWLSERGLAMKQATRDRAPVYADDWADSIGWFGTIELRLDSWRSRPGWVRYRAGPGRWHHRDWWKKLGDEGAKRRQRADWFDRWRRGGYHGAPPGGGNWVTAPGGGGGRPSAGAGGGSGKWPGRPRAVAPPTPGQFPRGDGMNGRPHWPRPPRDDQSPGPTGAPATPAPGASPPPVRVVPPARLGEGDPRNRPPRLRFPVPVESDASKVAPPSSTPAPTPSPEAMGNSGRPDRPQGIFRFNRGNRADGSPPVTSVPARPAPLRDPPMAVAPRATLAPHAAPPPPPPPPSAPPPPPRPSSAPVAGARPAPPPPAPRPVGSGPSARAAGGLPRGGKIK